MDLDESTEELAALLGFPVVVLDEFMNLVTHTAQRPGVDRAQLSIILTRRGTEGAIAALRAMKVSEADGPVRLPPAGDVPGHVAVPLRHRGDLTGFVTYEDLDVSAPISPAQLEALASASRRLGALLAARAIDRRRNLDRDRELMTELLGASRDRGAAAVREIIESGRLRTSMGYSAVVLLPAEHVQADECAVVLDDAISAVRRGTAVSCFASVLDRQGVAVFPHVSPDLGPAGLIRSADLGPVVLGAGLPVERLDEIPASYLQAHTAARAGAADPLRHPSPVAWDSLGWDRILLRLPLEHLSIDDLSPAIARLRDSDDGDVLWSSLEVYLERGGNAVETARALSVHRSTLYYRLDRIRAILGEDLGDPAVRLDLQISLRVAKLTGAS